MECLCVCIEHCSSPAADGAAVDACGRSERGGAAAARTDPVHAAAAHPDPQPAAGKRRSAARDHTAAHGKHSSHGTITGMDFKRTVPPKI